MLSRIGAFALIIATACAASQSKPPKPWRLELATSGGIAGRGVGNVAIDSDGNVSVTTMARKSCSFRAADEELARIESLLAAAKPEGWGNYVPDEACCDRIAYTLTYDEHSAEWIDNPKPMPADLVALSEALGKLRGDYAANCK